MSDDRVSYMYQRDPSIDRRYRPRPVRQYNLLKDFSEDESVEDTQSSTATNYSAGSQSSSDSVETGASVFLRLRPNNQPCTHYAVESNTFKVSGIENTSTNNKDLTEKHFEFSNIFRNDASQMDVYNSCVNAYIENEDSLTVLTYGTSGSGKTHTMYGSDDEAGIIPRAIVHLFARYKNIICDDPGLKIEKGNATIVSEQNCTAENQLRTQLFRDLGAKKSQFDRITESIREAHSFQPTPKESNGASRLIFVWMSFVEIYNENVHDLLKPCEAGAKRKNLKILSNDGNAFIKDLTSVYVKNEIEAFAVLNFGLHQVQYATTNINSHSSRSHCILIMNVIHFTHPDLYNVMSYKFCDLAGSERLKKTENVGTRLKEAQRINTSLMVLGRCLDLLYQNQTAKTKEVVPFRESKLTQLLQKSLVGREKITTIVNMMPTLDFIEENLQVLNFASIAQKIIYTAPKPVPTRRGVATRSTRFSWFAAPLQERNDRDWECMIVENERLADENFELKNERSQLVESIKLIHQENTKKEQMLRKTLVEEHEKQMNETINKYEQRLKYVENRYKQDVSSVHSRSHSIQKNWKFYFVAFISNFRLLLWKARING